MNKLFITALALSSMFSLVAMEKEQEYRLKPITKEESNDFVKYAYSALDYSYKAVEDGKIASNNALHKITHAYVDFLILANNNLATMIEQKNLHDRLESFKKFEFDEEVVKIKDSLLNSVDFEHNKLIENVFKGPTCTIVEGKKAFDITQLTKNLTERRKLLAALNLELKQPTYSRPKTNDANARINSMVENKDYSLDEEAIKDYLATLIYRQVLAHRTIIYLLQDKKDCVVEEL